MLSSLQLQLCDIQGRLFELSLLKNFESENFINLYMKSKCAANYGLKYNRLQWVGEEYLLEELVYEFRDKLIIGKLYSKDEMYWIGYTYSYWHLLIGENSKKIVKQAPPKMMKRSYVGMHIMDMQLVIDDLKKVCKNLV